MVMIQASRVPSESLAPSQNQTRPVTFRARIRGGLVTHRIYQDISGNLEWLCCHSFLYQP